MQLFTSTSANLTLTIVIWAEHRHTSYFWLGNVYFFTPFRVNSAYRMNRRTDRWMGKTHNEASSYGCIINIWWVCVVCNLPFTQLIPTSCCLMRSLLLSTIPWRAWCFCRFLLMRIPAAGPCSGLRMMFLSPLTTHDSRLRMYQRCMHSMSGSLFA